MPMIPLFLSHQLVHPFKFWYDNQLQEGIRFGKELYCFVADFAAADRQKAFSLAVSLAEQGTPVYITCMGAKYKVWVNLGICPHEATTAA
ncbi:MAG TPA: hypothetical protein V6C63_00820 [Allocoleopsis sp.]